MCAFFVRSLSGLLLVLAAALPARAEDELAYVGVWSLEIRNCGAEQSSPDSPMLIAKDHYDQYQTHCEFKSVEDKEGDFKISADCTVAGNAQKSEFVLTVSGDTLTFTDDAGARDLLRCK